MSFNDKTFKKLGFRPKAGNKQVLTASAEVEHNSYITLDIEEIGGSWKVIGVEVDGASADKIRKEYLKSYSAEEVVKLFTDY